VKLGLEIYEWKRLTGGFFTAGYEVSYSFGIFGKRLLLINDSTGCMPFARHLAHCSILTIWQAHERL
jgi:hypothetical protein